MDKQQQSAQAVGGQAVAAEAQTVNLIKLAYTKNLHNNGPLKLVMDSTDCLDRLYGGYYPDWLSGGQWSRTVGYIQNLSQTVNQSNLELVIFFNGQVSHGGGSGGDGSETDPDWLSEQAQVYNKILKLNELVRGRKNIPKELWLPPPFLESALKLMFREVTAGGGDKIKYLTTITSSHHLEIVNHLNTNHLHGLIGNSLKYLNLLKPDQHYYQSSTFKLSYKNTIDIVEVDLKDVKAAAAAADAQKVEEVKTNDKVENGCNFQNETQAVEEDVTVPVKDDSGNPSPSPSLELVAEVDLIDESARMLAEATASSILPKAEPGEAEGDTPEPPADGVENSTATPSASAAAAISELTADLNNLTLNQEYKIAKKVEQLARKRCLTCLMSCYVWNIIKHRHIKLPLRFHIIPATNTSRTNSTSDSPPPPPPTSPAFKTLPSPHLFYRPLRQNIYSILYNMNHRKFLNKAAEPIIIKESYYNGQGGGDGQGRLETENVKSSDVGWLGLPTLEKLWFGDDDICKEKRLRTFFTCLDSYNVQDLLLDSAIIPQHLIIICCLLRYMIIEGKFLRKNELDGFLLQSLINIDPEGAQGIELPHLTPRTLALSHLFMEGVEMISLLNDTCGSPIPSPLLSPWKYFNGKLFCYCVGEFGMRRSCYEICRSREIVERLELLREVVLTGVRQVELLDPLPYQLQQQQRPPYQQIKYDYTYDGLTGLVFTQPEQPRDLPLAAAAASRDFVYRQPQPLLARGGGGGGVPRNFRNQHHPIPILQPLISRGHPISRGGRGGGGGGAVSRGYPAPSDYLVSRGAPRLPPPAPSLYSRQLQVAGTVVGSWNDNSNYVRRNPIRVSREFNALFGGGQPPRGGGPSSRGGGPSSRGGGQHQQQQYPKGGRNKKPKKKVTIAEEPAAATTPTTTADSRLDLDVNKFNFTGSHEPPVTLTP